MRVTSVFALGLAASLIVVAAQAQVLYRYLDKDGKVVVTDKPPKGVPFDRIEYDRNTNLLQSPKRTTDGKPGATQDADARINRRTQLRDQLLNELNGARARLAAAQEALSKGRDPKDDEWQPTVTPPDNGGRPNSKGVITGRGGRVVCNRDGAGRVVCPAVPVPSETYYARLEALEKAVESAEQAVHAAEQNYRRNAPD